MAELSLEQYEQLPDFVKGDYEQNGDVYIPVAEGKLSVLKGKMNDLDSKYKTASSRIEEIERSKASEIEAARDEALKTAMSKGDVAAVQKRYEEQMADLEKRSGETLKQYQDRIDKMVGQIKTEKRTSVISELARELKIIEKSTKLFNKVMRDRIDVDAETGKITFLDENGGATSLDKAGFLAELAKDEAFDSMRQAESNKGGLANGNSGGGASKKPQDYTEQERVELFRKNPAEFHKLFGKS